MKHLKIFEEYSKKDIKRFLVKAEKDKDLTINSDMTELLNKLDDSKIKERFGFIGFVESDGAFISQSVYMNAYEYVHKFKEMGLDTTKIEKLLPNVKKYNDLSMLSYNEDRGKEMDELREYVDLFDIEIRKLATEAEI